MVSELEIEGKYLVNIQNVKRPSRWNHNQRAFLCPFRKCNSEFDYYPRRINYTYSYYRALERLRRHIHQHFIDRNFWIAENSKGFRRKLAIYRLYRYLDVSPKNIAYGLGWTVERHGARYGDAPKVRDIIGEMFKFFCLTDNKCVFRRFLENDEEEA